MQRIKDEAVRNGTFMKAPNGKKSNLNERQWLQVRTDGFKKWFGDWENDPANASKVVDENGEPKPVYHGTNNTEEENTWNEKHGWYDTKHTEFTAFKTKGGNFFNSDKNNAAGYGNYLYEEFLDLKSPLVIDAKGSHFSDIDFDGQNKDTYDWALYAKRKGYDGLIVKNVRDGVDYGDLQNATDDYVAFNPNKIKSATDNNGNFDDSSNDIRFQFIGEQGAAALDKPRYEDFNGDVIAFARALKEWNQNNLEGISKSDNFAEKNKKNGTGNKTGLDNRGAMVNSSTRSLVGSGQEGARIEQTLAESNRQGSGRTADSGIRKGWDKGRFLGALEVASRQNGTWIDDISSIAGSFIGKGYENEAYRANDGKNVIKINNLNFLNDDDTQYENTRDFDYFIDRLYSHNQLFPKDKYQIIGFAENANGEVGVVLQQPYVYAPEYASMEQINNWLSENSFEEKKSSDGMKYWTNGKYELSDLKPQNVLVDTNGDLRFIDADIVPVRNEQIELIEETDREKAKTNDNSESDDIRFQASLSNSIPQSERDLDGKQLSKLNQKASGFWERFITAHQSSIRPVELWLNALRKNGFRIADYDDYFMRFTSIPGKIDAKTSFYNEAFYRPLLGKISEIQEKGKSYSDIGYYMMLKHAPERTRQQYERAIREGKEADIEKMPDNGVSAIVARIRAEKGIEGEPLSRQEAGAFAEKWVRDFEDVIGDRLTAELWDKIRSATDWTINTRYEAGLIDRKQRDELLSMFNNYVPLRGHAEDTAGDLYDYGMENGTFHTPQNKRAEGRRSIAEDPIAFIFSNAQSSIRNSVENLELMPVARIAARVQAAALRDGKKPSVTVSKTWFVKDGEEGGRPKWKVADEVKYPDDPDLSPEQQAEEYRRRVEANDAWMESLAEKGDAFRGKSGKLDIGAWIKPAQARQHDVNLWVNGEMRTVRFNMNPAVPRAINRANRVYAERHHALVNGTIKFMGDITRTVSKMYTTLKPAFALFTNPARDLTFGASNVYMKEGGKYFGKWSGNYAIALATIPRYLAGKGKNLDDKYIRYYSEYIMNGGKTGLSNILELKAIQKKINRELRIQQGSGAKKLPLHAWNYIHSAFESVNEYTENVGRFAAYITSMEMGRGVVRSISDAKEITVNFNRKGSGAMGNSELRSLWSFTNVGIQGAQNITRAAIEHPVRFAEAATFWTAISLFAVPTVNHLLATLICGDDDDEKWLDAYSRLSEYERNNNICFYTGEG
ncbi:MAG: hypothetical protein LBH19_00475, partial [Dysgonamonadaceae bacterium]|nr:hypothetical protein [Dysgonamonadaceae bacterium]